MTCQLPPELDEIQLLAFLDDEDDPEVAMHLQQCPHCRSHMDQLAAFQARLAGRLRRASCPTSLELGEYHLGLAPAGQMTAIATHSASCVHCRSEIAQLQGYLLDLRPEIELSPVERVRSRARVVVARLVDGLTSSLGPQPAWQIAPVAVRGEESGPMVYTAGVVQVMIDVQHDDASPGSWTILGLVTGLKHPGQAVARLCQDANDEEGFTSAPLDDLGNFSFVIPSSLHCSKMFLIISGPEPEIQIQDLRIG